MPRKSIVYRRLTRLADRLYMTTIHLETSQHWDIYCWWKTDVIHSSKPCQCKAMAVVGVLVRSMLANGLGALYVKACNWPKRMRESLMNHIMSSFWTTTCLQDCSWQLHGKLRRCSTWAAGLNADGPKILRLRYFSKKNQSWPDGWRSNKISDNGIVTFQPSSTASHKSNKMSIHMLDKGCRQIFRSLHQCKHLQLSFQEAYVNLQPT